MGVSQQIKTSAIWLARAGSHGEHGRNCLDNNIVIIGWEELGDISKIKNRDELVTLFESTYLNQKPKAR